MEEFVIDNKQENKKYLKMVLKIFDEFNSTSLISYSIVEPLTYLVLITKYLICVIKCISFNTYFILIV